MNERPPIPATKKTEKNRDDSEDVGPDDREVTQKMRRAISRGHRGESSTKRETNL